MLREGGLVSKASSPRFGRVICALAVRLRPVQLVHLLTGPFVPDDMALCGRAVARCRARHEWTLDLLALLAAPITYTVEGRDSQRRAASGRNETRVIRFVMLGDHVMYEVKLLLADKNT